MSDDLEPIDPETAVEMYLDDRRHNVAEATLQAHYYRLKQFTEWCQDQGIENLNTLTGRDLHKYRVKRRNEDELATASMKGQLATLRMLLRFCATIDTVEPKLDEKIILSKTTQEDARDEMLESDQAEKILDHLERYEYATLEHTLIEVLWHTGVRIGAARSLDIEDYNHDEQYLAVEHDPEQDTPIKNGNQGERFVAVNDRVSGVLDDWLEVNHPGKTDEYGRTPLFAANQGRLSRNYGRSIAYQWLC